MAEVRTTFCRICIAACGMRITVDGDQVLGIRGDPSHPLTRGYLCAKGRALGDAHHSPNRLDGAFVGRGPDRRAVSIDEAHAELAGVLARITAEHGLGSIGVFHGTGAFQDALGSSTLRRLKRALGTDHLYSTATVDAVAKTLVAEQMAGTPLLIPNIDEDHGRLLVFVGINPVVSHGHATMFSNPVERIRAARRRGPVFTLDPRSTETARLSDHHLAVRPGTDYAVFAHAIRELLVAGVDETALAERATGVDALRDAVAPFDADDGEQRDRSDGREQLDAFVTAVRQAGRLAVLSGTGSTMPRSGNVTEWLAWTLMVLTDSFDQPGGMWFNPGYFARLDRFERLPSAAPSEPSPPSRPDIARSGGEWPSALIADEIEAGRLRALIVTGSNLLTALPEPRTRRRRPRADRRARRHRRAAQRHHRPSHPRCSPAPGSSSGPTCCRWSSTPTPCTSTTPTGRPASCRPSSDVADARPDRRRHRPGRARLRGRPDWRSRPTSCSPAWRAAIALERLHAAGDIDVDGGPAYGWVQSRLPFGRWDLAPPRLVAQLAALSRAGVARADAAPDDEADELAALPRGRAPRGPGPPDRRRRRRRRRR